MSAQPSRCETRSGQEARAPYRGLRLLRTWHGASTAMVSSLPTSDTRSKRFPGSDSLLLSPSSGRHDRRDRTSASRQKESSARTRPARLHGRRRTRWTCRRRTTASPQLRSPAVGQADEGFGDGQCASVGRVAAEPARSRLSRTVRPARGEEQGSGDRHRDACVSTSAVICSAFVASRGIWAPHPRSQRLE